MGGKLNFVEDFMLSGIAAGVSKTAAAPIERVKVNELFILNPYKLFLP